MHGLLIVCRKRALESLLDAMEDWHEDARILLYGTTSKAQDGFIVMHWTQPMPPAFQEKQLKADPGIIDYVVYDLPPPVHLQPSDTPTTL